MKILKKIWLFLYAEFILPPRIQFLKWRDLTALRRECKNADYLSEMNNGMKFVVMKNGYNKYQSFNKKQFLEYRRKRRGVFNRKATWEMILEDASYKTT